MGGSVRVAFTDVPSVKGKDGKNIEKGSEPGISSVGNQLEYLLECDNYVAKIPLTGHGLQ